MSVYYKGLWDNFFLNYRILENNNGQVKFVFNGTINFSQGALATLPLESQHLCN